MASKTQRPSVFFLAVCSLAVIASGYLLRSSVAGPASPGDHLPFQKFLRPTARISRLDRNEKARSKDSVFDPVLAYSTFLGGTAPSDVGTPPKQAATGVFVDGSGSVYVVGETSATDFPTTTGVVQATNPSNEGIEVGFLCKLSAAGKVTFCTYLSGMRPAAAVAVDSAGNILVAGLAGGAGATTPLPIPQGSAPFDPTVKPISIVKLNSTATSILNATYLGGSGTDLVGGIALDASGNVYIAGSTTSNDFPTMGGIQGSLGTSGQNAFLTKLNPTLSGLIYSTYLGQNSSAVGAGSETVTQTANHGVAVDASGNAYVGGIASSGFPSTPGAAQTTCTARCPFLAKVNAGGSALAYSSYVPGISNSGGLGLFVNAVAVDTSQNVFLAGGATSAGFNPANSLAPCAGTSGNESQGSGFVSEINAAGALAFSTCLGNFNVMVPQPNFGVNDLVLGNNGNLYVVGSPAGQLPLTNPIQTNTTGQDMFVAIIDPSTPSILFSSLIAPGQAGIVPGSTGGNFPAGVGVDSNSNIDISGFYQAAGAPLSLPVFNAAQPATNPVANATYSDAFALQISPTDAAASGLIPGVLQFSVQPVGLSSTPQTLTITDMGSSALTVSNVVVSGDFSIQNNCGSVALAGGTCTIDVTFTPTVPGVRTGAITITDNSAGSPHTVPLNGVGGQGTATISPTSLSFGNQAVGTTSAAQTVTLTNSGTLALDVSHIQAGGEFQETNNCGTSLAANASCTASVTFSPTSSGQVTNVLIFTDSAVDSPQNVTLSGTGTGGSSSPPPTTSVGLGVAPGGSASVTVSAGAAATYSLAIGGQGVAGTASLSCSGAPQGVVCSVPATTAVSGSTASTFNVSVTTTARSSVWLWLRSPRINSLLWALALLACFIFWKSASSVSRPTRLRWRLVPLFAVLLCACGGGGGGGSNNPSGPDGTQAGTYTLVITAKAGSTTQSLNLTLVVK
jgi:Abnormal spindle-like microcephaly-assoc'd, ASPM-SPD-2-Hydin/Beta-propeller repeat